MNTEIKGLGYRYVRDPRSDHYLLSPRLRDAPQPPTERLWTTGLTLDQGEEGSCVGHGWAHWLNAADSQVAARPDPVDHSYAVKLYNWAQQNDEWADTPPEEGTSVLAGAKAAVYHKHLKEGYLWGRGSDELMRWVGTYGPAVVGTLWKSGMRPDAQGIIRADGKISGGHCYLCVGYVFLNREQYLVFQNSWGEDWGVKVNGIGGFFYMSVSEWDRLISQGNYSICTPMELAPEPAPDPTDPHVYRTRVTPAGLASRPSLYRGKYLEIFERRGGQETVRWKADPV